MRKIAFILLAILFIAGCSKDKEAQEADFCTDGTIIWGGNPTVDGLGWLFKPDNDRTKTYSLQNLPDNYQVDSLRVNVCLYDTKEKLPCLCTAPPGIYHITSIKRL